MSFGQEDVDRYIVVYKKDHGPSEDEVFARRNGEEWNAETAQKYAQMVNWQMKISFCLLIMINYFFQYSLFFSATRSKAKG